MWTDSCGMCLHSLCPDRHGDLFFGGLRVEANFFDVCLCACALNESKDENWGMACPPKRPSLRAGFPQWRKELGTDTEEV